LNLLYQRKIYKYIKKYVTTQVHSSRVHGSRLESPALNQHGLRQAAMKIERFSDSSDPPRRRRYWGLATGTRIDSEYQERNTINRELWTV